MKVLYGEGVANHTGPELCAATREGRSEALTGDSVGQPLSGENQLRSADALRPAEGNTARASLSRDTRSAPRRRRPWHARTPLCSGTGRSPDRLAACRTTAAREGRRPKPTMYGPEKSDPPIVAVKPANKAVRAAAEPVEPRGGTKENADPQSTVRTQSREAVSQAQARIREAVNQEQKGEADDAPAPCQRRCFAGGILRPEGRRRAWRRWR